MNRLGHDPYAPRVSAADEQIPPHLRGAAWSIPTGIAGRDYAVANQQSEAQP